MKGQKFYGKGAVAHVEDHLTNNIVEAFIEDDKYNDVIDNICQKLPTGTKVSITIEVIE